MEPQLQFIDLGAPIILYLRVDEDGQHHLDSTLPPPIVANVLRAFAEMVERGWLVPPKLGPDEAD